jgi:hypothetical protein
MESTAIAILRLMSLVVGYAVAGAFMLFLFAAAVAPFWR